MSAVTEKEEDDDHLIEKPLCENNSRLCAETPTLLADLFVEVSYTLYLCGINSIVQKITTLGLKCTGNTMTEANTTTERGYKDIWNSHLITNIAIMGQFKL